jgi:hypothetical protein
MQPVKTVEGDAGSGKNGTGLRDDGADYWRTKLM